MKSEKKYQNTSGQACSRFRTRNSQLPQLDRNETENSSLLLAEAKAGHWVHIHAIVGCVHDGARLFLRLLLPLNYLDPELPSGPDFLSMG